MVWHFYCFMKDFGNIYHFDSAHEVQIDVLKVVVNDIIDLR